MGRHHEQPSDAPATTTVDDIPVHRYRSYARNIRNLLYLGGILQEHTRPVVQSYVTGLLVIFISLSQVILIINFIRDYSDNLLILAKCLGLASSFISPFLMMCCFLVKRDKLLELHKTLDDLLEKELARDRRTKATILASVYAFARPSYTVVIMLGSTVLAYLLPSMINAIRSASTARLKMPFPVKFPWKMPSSGSLFCLHFLYQMTVCWCMVFTIGAVDSLFGFYAFQISSILYAMSVRLTTPRPDEVFSAVLKTCTETHHRLLQSVRLLEDIYGIILLRMIVTNAVMMCALIFEASPFTDMTINQGCLLVCYLTLKLLQTFIYAWYGSLITSASEHFRERIYFSEWPDSRLDRHVRAGVVMTMLQKPMTITALKMSSVNVNMFTNVSVESVRSRQLSKS
ncbi:PREDICTED: uncharacterized protein LOC106749023 [Dinoponera quadriceps]|uniref:Odorant receptor n=1 Tax=Dinoponera quadriceps TaxID=609295 RepID=A0A6P3XY99_DINQU|nr:PREDICTED: uncharacterized protein LOC106749023 [Dinoponera quadriceps]